MKRKVLSIVLTMAMVLALVPTAFAEGEAAGTLDNFTKVNTYQTGQFYDVNEGEWYFESVKAAYEYGLVKGNIDGSFNVGGNITIAETLALACRLNDIYYGGDGSFVQGEPWYQVYVDYAAENGIIGDSGYASYDAVATRAQFATILAKALPDEALTPINNVTKVPDVSKYESYAKGVLKLYNAGILTGSDEKGTFNPYMNISRVEVAAIITRMADPTLRKTVSFYTGPFADIEGIYTSADGDALYIDEDGNVEISIYRLTTMEGKASEVYKNIVPITVTDPNGNQMRLEFLLESGELIVVESSWNYIKAGDIFKLSKVTSDLEYIAGAYRSEDGSSLIIGADGGVVISIVRLTTMEGSATGIFSGVVPMTVTDANGNLMRLDFTVESGTLTVINSTWDYLENGESFVFEKAV